jgi:valyl-tRNA synthetase
VHRSGWPRGEELRALAGEGDAAVLDVASEVLSLVHKAKTSERRSLRTHVERLVIEDAPDRLDALRFAESDVRGAGNVHELVLREGDTRLVSVELEAEPA